MSRQITFADVIGDIDILPRLNEIDTILHGVASPARYLKYAYVLESLKYASLFWGFMAGIVIGGSVIAVVLR
jgi:hypothetical protein